MPLPCISHLRKTLSPRRMDKQERRSIELVQRNIWIHTPKKQQETKLRIREDDKFIVQITSRKEITVCFGTLNELT